MSIWKRLVGTKRSPIMTNLQPVRLNPEALEDRTLLAAPIIGSLALDIAAPSTSDALHIQVVDAADVDNDPITFQFDWRVNGQLVQATTSADLFATLDLSQPGFGDRGDTISVNVTPLDSYQSGNALTLSTSVIDSAPIVTLPEEQVNFIGDSLCLQVEASDADGDALTFSATGLPLGLGIDGVTGLITGTVSRSAATSEPYVVSVTATGSDLGNVSTVTFNWHVLSTNLHLFGPGDQENLAGDAVSLEVRVWDTANHPVTFTAANLPEGVTIDSVTGLISGTIAPAAAAAYPYLVTITATDADAALTSTATFIWTVSQVLLAHPGEQFTVVGDSVNLAFSASAAGGGTIIYGAQGLPPGLAIDTVSGIITGDITSESVPGSLHTVTITATHTSSTGTATKTFSWSIAAPEIYLYGPENQTTLAGTEVYLETYAETNSGHSLTFAAMNLPDGLTIDPSTGDISGMVSAEAIAETPYQVTITVNDDAACVQSQATFTWTVTGLALSRPDDQHSLPGDSINLAADVVNVVSAPVTFSASNLPAGLAIDPDTGVITGTVADSAVSDTPYSVNVTVCDDVSSVTQTFMWTVQTRYVYDPDVQVNVVGDSVSLPLTVTAEFGMSLLYSAVNLPPGLSIDASTGVISGTIRSAANTTDVYTVSITVAEATTSATPLSRTFTMAWGVLPAADAPPATITDAPAATIQYFPLAQALVLNQTGTTLAGTTQANNGIEIIRVERPNGQEPLFAIQASPEVLAALRRDYDDWRDGRTTLQYQA